uniref:Uncharacterized protein n=1 Tax=Heterorhabditis bacteriophora TaxID=37862 RepID=A0A1I7X6M1_HETBA
MLMVSTSMEGFKNTRRSSSII